jgi:hypothetical protein
MNYALYLLLVLILTIETHILSHKLLAVIPEKPQKEVDLSFGLYLKWCYDNGLAPGHADNLSIYLHEEELENMLIELYMDEETK